MTKNRKPTADAAGEYPEWYWQYGLHDARVLSVTELIQVPDYKSGAPRYNALEMRLDTSGAMTQLKKITFYNYKFKPAIEIGALSKPWWMGDRLTRLSDGRYSLQFELEDADGDRFEYVIEFENASAK